MLNTSYLPSIDESPFSIFAGPPSPCIIHEIESALLLIDQAMGQQKFIQISLPKPCKQLWNNMQTTPEGHYCSHCQHVVTDFSEMGDAEIARIFLKAEGQICGRFTSSQLGRPLMAPIPVRPAHWPKLMLGALVLLVSPHLLLAQSPVKPTVEMIDGVEVPIAEKTSPIPAKSRTSKVLVRQEGAHRPIAGASITVNEQLMGLTDEDGRFLLVLPENMNQSVIEVAVTHVGFSPIIFDLEQSDLPATLKVKMGKMEEGYFVFGQPCITVPVDEMVSKNRKRPLKTNRQGQQ